MMSVPTDQTRTETDWDQAMCDLGAQLRIDSIRLADEAGSGHPTSSMSAADMIAVLVANHLSIDPERPDAPGNDRLVFSKGHATPLLYSTLAHLGVLSWDQAHQFRQSGNLLEGHPTPLVPGVPVATGSLGLGLPMGIGLALAARDLDHTSSHVWVLCGDSEMAEGSMWEAMEHAGSVELANLTALVDVNRLGQTGPTRHGWDL
jgi:transketolase